MATCVSCQQTLTEGTKFCNNCGAPVGGPSYSGTAPQPPAQGGPSYAGTAPASPAPQSPAPAGVIYTKFCASCGKGLVSAAVICPNCGAAQKGFNVSGGKSKTAAVLMAIFLSAWTWVYTWKVNSKKFLTALCLWVVQIIISIVGVSEAANKLVCTPGGACSFRSGSAGILLFAWLIGFGIWVWAIVDASIKSQAYYAGI
jgi:RNA polymerase subunit RPABC4/transcription elongation factor Spt4